MSTRPRRSVLYMPGSNARALEKARTLPADSIIFDLEDAVAPEAKETARVQVYEALKTGGFGARETVLRINDLSTPWGEDDLKAAAATSADIILIPKVSEPETLTTIGTRLNTYGANPATRIFIMIETAQAMLNLKEIAKAAQDPLTRLSGFVMGTNDLAKETRARLVEGREPMLTFLSQSLTAARAYNLAIIDGVYNDIKNLEGFKAECEQGRNLGMDGKTLIHPDQITIANEIFAPSPEEVEQARKLIATFDLPENQGKGAISLNGRMVERLHADMAAHTLALHNAIMSRQ